MTLGTEWRQPLERPPPVLKGGSAADKVEEVKVTMNKSRCVFTVVTIFLCCVTCRRYPSAAREALKKANIDDVERRA